MTSDMKGLYRPSPSRRPWWKRVVCWHFLLGGPKGGPPTLDRTWRISGAALAFGTSDQVLLRNLFGRVSKANASSAWCTAIPPASTACIPSLVWQSQTGQRRQCFTYLGKNWRTIHRFIQNPSKRPQKTQERPESLWSWSGESLPSVLKRAHLAFQRKHGTLSYSS